MNTRRTFRLVDWLLAAVIGVFLVGAVIAQAHSAPLASPRGGYGEIGRIAAI